MRLATLRDGSLGVIVANKVVLLNRVLEQAGVLAKQDSMMDLLEKWDEVRLAVESALKTELGVDLAGVSLGPPVPKPSKIWGAASNYKRGSSSLEQGKGRGEGKTQSAEEIMELTFLKPASAIIGPGDDVVIPRNAETVFPELELGVVIGKKAEDLPVERAMESVFGYTIILDVTARGYGSGTNLVATRCVRKGFNTFAPTGPWIVTSDEIPDPQNLRMRLWVNGELRQSANTEAMINGVAELVSYLSKVSTLLPGDLIATGNPDSPAFQKQLTEGDTLRAEIEHVGQLDLGVKRA